MLDVFWTFLKDPANREVLGWVGAGIVAVAGGVWAVVKFFSKKDEGSKPNVNAEGGGVAIGGSSIGSTINTAGTRASVKRKR
jgi:hypothetical protein